MTLLGSFLQGQSLQFSVSWVPQVGDTVTGSTLTLTHETEGTIVTVVGVSTGTNAFKAVVTINVPGRWNVSWTTTPAGGITENVVYIEPV